MTSKLKNRISSSHSVAFDLAGLKWVNSYDEIYFCLGITEEGADDGVKSCSAVFIRSC